MKELKKQRRVKIKKINLNLILTRNIYRIWIRIVLIIILYWITPKVKHKQLLGMLSDLLSSTTQNAVAAYRRINFEEDLLHTSFFSLI